MHDAPFLSSFGLRTTCLIGRALLRLASPRHQHLRLRHLPKPPCTGLSEPALLHRVHAQEKLPHMQLLWSGPVF